MIFKFILKSEEHWCIRQRVFADCLLGMTLGANTTIGRFYCLEEKYVAGLAIIDGSRSSKFLAKPSIECLDCP